MRATELNGRIVAAVGDHHNARLILRVAIGGRNHPVRLALMPDIVRPGTISSVMMLRLSPLSDSQCTDPMLFCSWRIASTVSGRRMRTPSYVPRPGSRSAAGQGLPPCTSARRPYARNPAPVRRHSGFPPRPSYPPSCRCFRCCTRGRLARRRAGWACGRPPSPRWVKDVVLHVLVHRHAGLLLDEHAQHPAAKLE